TLHRLAGYEDVAAAVADAGAREPEFFETHIARIEGGFAALWEGDAGYDTNDGGAPGARHRLSMLPTGWRHERTDADCCAPFATPTTGSRCSTSRVLIRRGDSSAWRCAPPASAARICTSSRGDRCRSRSGTRSPGVSTTGRPSRSGHLSPAASAIGVRPVR